MEELKNVYEDFIERLKRLCMTVKTGGADEWRK